MIVFLEKVRVDTYFSLIDPIITEPLELMYLQTILSQENIESHIIDIKFDKQLPMGVYPDIIILNGYNVSENIMISKAKIYKKMYPKVKIMASGLHVQLNREFFRRPDFDYIFFSPSLETFRHFIKNGDTNKGLDFYNNETGKWHIGKEDPIYEHENIIPYRNFFYDIREKTHYLDKNGVALVKGSHGCPYKCNFCYCRLLNYEKYIKPDFKNLFKEINEISSKYIWIIDDCFLVNKNDASEFIEAFKDKIGGKSIIAYLRADFIVENDELISSLKKCGIDEVIIGFESPDYKTLKLYNKGQSSDIYEMAVRILRRESIDLTGLFIVDPGYKVEDFFRLFKYIKSLNLKEYTLSIMTPIRGTIEYKSKLSDLTTKNPRHFDFLHLVIPSRLPKWLFYSLFYYGHLRLLRSKRIRTGLIRAFKGIFKI